MTSPRSRPDCARRCCRAAVGGAAIEYLAHRVRRLPDTPHRIALGLAIGVFVSFTPFFGIHVGAAMALAWALRANIVASLIGTLRRQPGDAAAHRAGRPRRSGGKILGYGVTGRDPSRIQDAFGQFFSGLWDSLLSLSAMARASGTRSCSSFSDVIWPYLVGGLLPGLVAAIASYYVARPLVAAYQVRRRSRMLSRAHERLARQTEAAYKAVEGETGSKGP